VRTKGSARRAGERAVVVGASMAGLCAARVLAERFDEVLVVDRDALPEGPDARGQVPQGRHPHLLLIAGARLLEAWFPGIVDELEAGGAVDVDLSHDFYWYQGGGVSRRPVSGLNGPAMSRPFLEWTVRRRVETIVNVTVRGETAVSGFTTDDARRRITGVTVGDAALPCDLVVDATGRQARSLAWLEALEYEGPTTSLVTVDTRYVSRVHRRTDRPVRDWKAVGLIGDPVSKRLAMALPIEGERWLVFFGGLNGESAPTDDEGLLTYARSFESPVIADILEASEPLTAPATHRFPANQRRHVERLRRFPLGWVLLGDAVCSFDPIYGQGMTSAAQQAEVLGQALDRSRAIDRHFARRYFRAAGRVVAVPWSIAVGGDFVYEGTTGKKPAGTDVLNRYMARVAVAAQHDDAVAIRFNEVVALVRRPEALLTPAFVLRVLRTSRRGPLGLDPAPMRRPAVPTPSTAGRPTRRRSPGRR
jgi:2-polyprenyl-6-methoxyphenol hydroxylase-like FAD-dependent oxidoreductase